MRSAQTIITVFFNKLNAREIPLNDEDGVRVHPVTINHQPKCMISPPGQKDPVPHQTSG